MRGKDDPYLKVGQTNDRTTKGDSEYVWALKDINFEVKRGEVLGIIGRNGAGKSTLLKILSRVTAPTTGSVKAKGRIASLLEVGTGFHPELTGRENVYLNGAINGMSRAEVARKLDEIVDFSGCERYIDTPVKRYSSGMTVRLGFAVAAYLEPEILIVDEVLAVGDAQFQKKCLGKMQDVGKQGRTVLFVSHQMEAISKLCEKALMVHQGKIIEQGSAREVIDYYLQTTSDMVQVPLLERVDRTGSGRIRFTATWVEDIEGNRGAAILSGETLIIVTEYEVFSENSLRNIQVAYAVTNKSGARLTDLSNGICGENFEKISSNRGKIKCILPKLRLNAGRYMYNILIRAGLDVEDYIQNAGYFDIESGDFYHTGKVVNPNHGFVLLDQEWSLIDVS